MDVQQSLAILFNHFKKNDIYDPDSDFKKLDFSIFGYNDQNSPSDWEKRTAIQAGIQDMMKEGILREVFSGVKNKSVTYVIFESIQNQSTMIDLSADICRKIKKIVAGVLPLISLDATFDDKADVDERHIAILLETINYLSSNLKKKDDGDENQQTDNRNSHE